MNLLTPWKAQNLTYHAPSWSYKSNWWPGLRQSWFCFTLGELLFRNLLLLQVWYCCYHWLFKVFGQICLCFWKPPLMAKMALIVHLTESTDMSFESLIKIFSFLWTFHKIQCNVRQSYSVILDECFAHQYFTIKVPGVQWIVIEKVTGSVT